MKVMLKFVLVSALCGLALGGKWNYKKKTDTEWGATTDGEVCLSGTQQSPVTLDGVPDDNKNAEVTDQQLTAAYGDNTNSIFYNNGHGYQLEPAAGGDLGTVTYKAKSYKAVQYHFHFPSEHATKGGKLAAGEVHVVHASDDGELLVVGKFLDSTDDTESTWLTSLEWDDNVGTLEARTKGSVEISAAKCEQGSSGNTTAQDCAAKDKATCDAEGDGSACKFTAAQTEEKVTNAAKSQKTIGTTNTSDFIKTTDGKIVGNYWRYEGSLTTPPCSEIVHWFVLETPEKISTAQAKKFTDAIKADYDYEKTNRPLQPLVCNDAGKKELYWNTLEVTRLTKPTKPVETGDCKPAEDTPATTPAVITGKCEDKDGAEVTKDKPTDGWTEKTCKAAADTNKFTPDAVEETGETSGTSQVGFSVLLLAMLALFN